MKDNLRIALEAYKACPNTTNKLKVADEAEEVGETKWARRIREHVQLITFDEGAVLTWSGGFVEVVKCDWEWWVKNHSENKMFFVKGVELTTQPKVILKLNEKTYGEGVAHLDGVECMIRFQPYHCDLEELWTYSIKECWKMRWPDIKLITVWQRN